MKDNSLILEIIIKLIKISKWDVRYSSISTVIRDSFKVSNATALFQPTWKQHYFQINADKNV
jgi:hypothetical protein